MKQSPQHERGYGVVYPRGARDLRLVRAGRFPLSLLTVPGSLIYKGVVTGLRSVRIRARRGGHDGVRVVSIGNLEVGGNGKTPFATHVATHLVERGYRPVYVSRGFKGEAERIGPVTVRVPAGSGDVSGLCSGVRFIRDDAPELSRAIGDEGAMVSIRCPDVPLIFSSDRRRAVDTAIYLFQPTHVILDDAFQTWHVHRDLDIVLLDAAHPLGNGRVVPGGSLREPPEALRRSHVLGINGVASHEDLDEAGHQIESRVGRRIPVFGLRRRIEFFDARDGRHHDRIDGPVASLSSVARPQGVDDALTAAGADLRLSIRYPDHHRYSAEDLRRIRALAGERQTEWVVTTEKDWAKLREQELPFDRIAIARLELGLTGVDILSLIEKPRTVSAASS